MKEQKKFKISFTGDILCDFPELNYMKKNKYNFDLIFKNIQYKYNNELLVGNLETPICRFLPYTYEPFLFNSPKNFLNSLKKCGFNILSVANNHCLDRGIIGAKCTVNELNKYDILPVGIYYKENKNYDIIEYCSQKIAFISYTYGTNYEHNHCYLKDNKLKINLLESQLYDNTKIYNKIEFLAYNLKSFLKNTKFGKRMIKIKNKINKRENNNCKAHIIDDLNNKEWRLDKEYLKDLKRTIIEAKKNSDIVIFLLHSGGQFNKKVGTFTESIIRYISKLPVDIIIGNHPHIVQKFKIINDKPIFFSLGNFIFSPSSTYVNNEQKPEYSIKVNTYWEKNKIIKIKFEILKVVENEEGHSELYNTFDYYKSLDINEQKKLIKDCNFIINSIYDTKKINYIDDLLYEYDLIGDKK